jgi:hypothetical protein
MSDTIASLNVDDLIEWYWSQQPQSPGYGGWADGPCQCGTEMLIEASDDPNRMRSFLMFSVFIDQIVFTHFQDVYPKFRQRFKFPKLYAHGVGGMANAGWLVNTHHGYDKKMNWNAARPIGYQLFKESFEFLNNEIAVQSILKIAVCEAGKEFEREASVEVCAILSDVNGI